MSGVTQVNRLSPMRAMIARRMMESLHGSAQVSYHAELDAQALVRGRKSYRETSPHVGYEDMLIFELCRVLERFPAFNATLINNELQQGDAVHVSIAVALPGALIAPVIFDAHRKTVPELSEARRDLMARARSGRLGVREVTNGTITISNMGLTRTRYFTPVLNPPQTAIIGMGQIAERPWVAEGSVRPMPVLGLSLTTDHRVHDGQPSGLFLTAVCEALERTAPAQQDLAR